MLVLTRRIGESVVIHDDIYCTVLGYNHDVVRLAFDAPKSVPINRDEIQRRIYQAKISNDWYSEPAANQDSMHISIVDRLINKFKSSPAPVNA